MPYEPRSHHPVILCVDDDREILSALRRSLSREPYEVITAQGVDEALCWFEEFPIDLLITDIGLPGGLNGRQVPTPHAPSAPALRFCSSPAMPRTRQCETGRSSPACR